MTAIPELLDWARVCYDADGLAADKALWRQLITILESLTPQMVDEDALRAAYRAYKGITPDMRIEWSLFGMHRAILAYINTITNQEVNL